MRNNRNNRKKNLKKRMRLDEFFTEERFDEEDEDSVTDDTLEFLCLDDEMAESYEDGHKDAHSVSKVSSKRYEEDEEYADEDEDTEYEEVEYTDAVYGDEEEDADAEYGDKEEDADAEYVDEEEEYADAEYEDEEYDDYADEDEEYDEFEDEDEEFEYADKRGGVIIRLRRFFAEMSTLDMVVAVLGIVVFVGALMSGVLYANAKSIEKQVASFESVGEEVEGISVIGEGGLLAVSESAKLAGMAAVEEEPEEAEEEEETEEEEQNKTIEVTLNVTSIQSDIKIKFVNKATGKLIGSVPFEVAVSGGKKTLELKDEDKDGIIYKTEIEAGTYQVTVKPFKDGDYEEYKLPASAVSVKVTDTIAYKKVDVADEVKSESEINAAKEDTAVQDTAVESKLQDTVEWVESTKTLIDSDEGYKEINKDQIPAPATSGAVYGYMKMVNDGIMPLSEPTPPECTCDNECQDQENANQDCDVCSNNFENCRHKQNEEEGEGGKEESQNCICKDRDKCTADIKNEACPVCRTDISRCEGKEKATETKPEPAKCTCQNKCKNGAVDSNCEVCKGGTITSCTGKDVQSTVVSGINCPATLTVGSTGQASATTSPEGGTITWSSSDMTIVEIDAGSGYMTAKAVGSATITAKCGDSSMTAIVNVENVKYTAIALSGTNTVKVNGTVTISGKTTPEGGTISWTSDNVNVAKIESSSGTSATVKGVAAGTATITAKCGDAIATCTVTVAGDASSDTTTKLKDKNGNQVYVYKDGKYVEATYADYYSAAKFYLLQAKYKYTGWQTIDGNVYFFDKDGNYVTGEQVIQGAKYTFGSDGKLSSGSGSMGIDVSKWNGNIDWNAVKNSGVSYVIIRCGYRGSSTGVLVEDPKFRSNIKGAKAAGLKVGVYFFSQAVNEVEAVEEASMAVSLASGYGLNYPIFLDVESSGGRGDSVSKETRTAVCKAFCATVQNSGYSAGVYANKTWLTSYINAGSLTGYKIWLAQYASAPSYTATRYDMWQYSSKGKVSGISGNVDMNISYMNY